MSRLIVVFALLCSRLGDDNRAFDCTVRTDVNPSPIDVVVPAQQTVVVLTFRGCSK